MNAFEFFGQKSYDLGRCKKKDKSTYPTYGGKLAQSGMKLGLLSYAVGMGLEPFVSFFARFLQPFCLFLL